jgi:hypothetical protein
VLRIKDFYPGSWFLSITDGETRIQQQQQKRSGKTNFFPTFVVATNIKILKLFYIWTVKDIWASSQRIIVIFLPRKLLISSEKYRFGIRDPGSGKNLFRIPDPTVKKAPDPDPQHFWPANISPVGFWPWDLKVS